MVIALSIVNRLCDSLFIYRLRDTIKGVDWGFYEFF